MIYTIFIKKNQHDKARYKHVSLLRHIISHTPNVFILGWPGYIGTTKKYIDDFYDEINPFCKKQLNGFFFRSLNYKVSITGHGTNEQYMNAVFGGHTLPQPLLRDHSKILAVLSVDLTDYSNNYTEAIKNGAYSVKALLLGSSNQSYFTYCLPSAPKGEADILMIDIGKKVYSKKDEESAPLIEMIGSETFEKIAKDDNIVISRELKKTNKNLNAIVEALLNQ